MQRRGEPCGGFALLAAGSRAVRGTVLHLARLSLSAVVLVTGYPLAASAVSSGGFVVSPAFEELQVKSAVPQAQYTLQLSNLKKTDQTFLLSVVDFGTLDESGGVAFLGSPTSELEHKYGLASWMSLEKNTVIVQAGKSAAIVVSIENRQSLATGGHYGAVLATAVNDPGTPTGDRVGVKQVLASLVLVTKEGGARAELRLESQEINNQLWNLPTTVEQRFQNAGNVHVVPRGTVEVKDPTGRVVQRAAINEGSKVILPESFRRYRATFTNIKAAVLPGYYTLVSSYRYDGNSSSFTKVTGFWYAGQLVVWGTVLLALAAVAALVWWRWWRPRKKRST